jgi:hypothetical protein
MLAVMELTKTIKIHHQQEVIQVTVIAKTISVLAVNLLRPMIANRPHLMEPNFLNNAANHAMEVDHQVEHQEDHQVDHARMSTATVMKSKAWWDVVTKLTHSQELVMYAANLAAENGIWKRTC